MNTFKKVLYSMTRPYVKKYLTGNLGKVVEDDEKLTCYVKRRKIKKKKYHYTIACFGIGDTQKKVAKAYDLNKPICYVIDGHKFQKQQVYIFGYNNCEVIIKNCDFGLNLHIHVNGKCTLENTNITTFSYLSITANELVIKKMNSEQITTVCSESSFCFGADNRIEIIDSSIECQKKNINVSFLATNELNIVNSKINGNKIECKTKIIEADEISSLMANDKINLQTDNLNSINIIAPTIVLNGKEISNEKKSAVLQKNTEPLAIKREKLISLLKKIKTQCEDINAEKVLKYEEQLSVQPVSNVLKK